jgi:hypothetical protein
MKTVLLLIGFILASIDFAEAQQAAKVPTIGWLSPSYTTSATLGLFLREFHKHGYILSANRGSIRMFLPSRTATALDEGKQF